MVLLSMAIFKDGTDVLPLGQYITSNEVPKTNWQFLGIHNGYNDRNQALSLSCRRTTAFFGSHSGNSCDGLHLEKMTVMVVPVSDGD
jgi:hypothetical protein